MDVETGCLGFGVIISVTIIIMSGAHHLSVCLVYGCCMQI